MNYDVIVLGTGGVGSAAMFHLAKSGFRVLGLDRFPPGHNRGSSHGETRVIRRSYFEHPDYVPLLNSAYQLWDELSDASDKQLLHRIGVLYFGAPDSPVNRGILSSAAEHQIEVEQLTPAETNNRFPMFTAPEGAATLFEPDAGYLLVEDCVKAHVNQAIQLGAEHCHGETVISWAVTSNEVTVQTDHGRYAAAKLVIAAGSWTADVLAELGVPLRIVRKHLHWYAADDGRYRAVNNCPCYFFAANGGYFYGCPALEESGLKVAEHTGGTEIQDPLADPNTPEPADTKRIEKFLTRHLPGVSEHRLRHERCFYTMTNDEHFIVDRHPKHDNVVFAAGLSGHGFKFTSVLGQTLANMAMEVPAEVDVDFLRLNRATP